MKTDNGGDNLQSRTGRAPTPGPAAQSQPRTGRAPTPGAATQSRHLLALSAAALVILHSPFSILNSPAASLSLASTNDYVYVTIPTNGTVDVRGLGAGPEGLYTMPRREDWMFLAEAVSERSHVGEALLDRSAVVSVDRRFAETNETYAAMPNHWQNDVFPLIWKFDGIYATNVTDRAVLVMPTNFIARPAVCPYWDDSSLTPSYPLASIRNFMFSGSSYPVQRRMLTYDMVPETAPVFIGPMLLTFCYVTNAYSDVIANSSPTFFREMQCGDGGYAMIYDYHYDPRSRIGHYDHANARWSYNAYDDYSMTNTSSRALSYVERFYKSDRELRRRSWTACDGGATVATAREDLFDKTSQDYAFDKTATFPKFENGSVFNGIVRAFSVVNYAHELSVRTNGVYSAVYTSRHTILMPTTLSRTGTTQQGYPKFVEDYQAAMPTFVAACKRILGDRDRDFTDDDLKSLVNHPDYPDPLPSVRSYRSSENRATDTHMIRILGYVGCADVTFHARVLGN